MECGGENAKCSVKYACEREITDAWKCKKTDGEVKIGRCPSIREVSSRVKPLSVLRGLPFM